MKEIKQWGEDKLEKDEIEANSGLGKAIRYFNKYYESLSCFCRVEGAKLDNNDMERQLKIIVRNRKNAMFYGTQEGADIGDVITSMIATAAQAKTNVFDYFNALQRNKDKVQANPKNFLPWNYQENI
ncbi:MAG: transposase [Phenylobacterium sp.]|jgi:transposase